MLNIRLKRTESCKTLRQAASVGRPCQYFQLQDGTNSRLFPRQNGMRSLQLMQETVCFVVLCNQEFVVRVPYFFLYFT